MAEPEDEIDPELMAPFIVGPYTVLSPTQIDCTFLHPRHGALPFTADANDPEAHGRAAHAYALTQLP